MPRRKAPVPARLTAEEQEDATWRMGEQDQSRQEEGQSSSQDGVQPRDREYTVVFDDDDEIEGSEEVYPSPGPLYISSDDGDYAPPVSKPRKPRKPKEKKEKPPAPVIERDLELESLMETSSFSAEIRGELNNSGDFESSIEKVDLYLDMDRYDSYKVTLPERTEFRIYISDVPSRSFIYYEWFERREGETDKQLNQRQKSEIADHIKYFYIVDVVGNIRKIMDAFSVKQRVLQLKFHKYYELAGRIEVKVCITEDSLVKLNRPYDAVVRIPAQVRIALQTCLNKETATYTTEQNLNHDIDSLYEVVKQHHRGEREERKARVQVDPQHRSLLPQLRPYQADAVRWMLEKEHYKRNLDDDLDDVDDVLHPLYEEVVVHDGSVLYFNKYAGYLVRSKPLARTAPPGGILADEMGLGKTVEVLACMLNNPRRVIPNPDYLEPVRIESKKKKRSRRRRSVSPTEFVIRETDEVVNTIDSDILKPKDAVRRSIDGSIDSGRDGEELICQLDGGDTDQESSEDYQDDENDEDFVLTAKPVRKRPDKNDKRATRSLDRKYSEKRTVYYHEEFDSESSSDESVPLSKKRATSRRKSAPAEPPRKKAKVINTSQPVSDEMFPIYDPFRNGKVPDNNCKNFHDMIVKGLHQLGAETSNRNGVSVIQLKNYVKRTFDKDLGKPQLKGKFTQALNEGLQTGQLVKTSLGVGATGSLVLNPHYNPNDSRNVPTEEELPRLDQIVDDVITKTCYEGVKREKPHVPYRFQKLIKEKTAAREKEQGGNKGRLYDKLKTMYDMSLPMSLAAYASDKRSKDWNSTFFKTKVEQQSFFECICGGTEENSTEAGYRVQCRDCKTEQHAECMKYNIEDPYRGEYVCPHCWVVAERIPSGATLIVSPSAISFQWIEEIQKHIKHKDIKMFYYKGSKEMGYIQPRTLAKYDIVITSYETLSMETNYVDLPHSNSSEGRRFRNPKRFMAMPSPITCIEWWRICLDEAQMIESTTTKTAEMALRLSAVNKWCVTGTPLGKSINDLQGLLLFLQIDPYMVEVWWRKCVYQPYCHGIKEPLESLLCKILWRTCKKDVLDQIDIPSQREEIHWLQFSPVEEHFYRRQHIDITRDVIGRLSRFEGSHKLSLLDRQNLLYLLQPLLRLRQSCCHPQAVRGQFMALQKTTMTMEQLLEQLIKKASNEAEESHRQYVSALNGLAGLDIIQEKFADAAENYREVLRSAVEHEGRIKTDTLQRLHTVSNLAELLEAGHEDIQPTLRDSELKPMIKELKDKYMKKYVVGVTGARTAVEPVSDLVEEVYASISKDEVWYQEIINWVEVYDHERILMKIVYDELAQFFDIADEKEFREIQTKYPNSRIVMYKISEKLAEIDKFREMMKKDMKELVENDPELFLNAAVECHLRVSSLGKRQKKRCKLCEVQDSIDLYENVLFRFVKGEIKGSKGPNRASVTLEERKQLEQSGIILLDEQRRGTWSDSEAERMCRAIHKFAKTKMHNFKSSLMEEASNQMKLLENLKKEFRLARVLLRQIFDQVAGVDELNMSTLRLRLRYEDEPYISEASLKKRKKEGMDLSTRVREKAETIYILERHELDAQRLKLVADKGSSNSELKKKLGQLLYLKNLQGSEYGKRGGHNPEPCPICQKELGTQWSVLQCGHCYCVECIRMLLDEFSVGRSTKCAVCRSLTARAEISYVSTRAEDESQQMEMEAIDVKGSHSTKVEAVVRTLVRIRTEDSQAKSLVFSTWPDVLDIIADALDENDIPYSALHELGGKQSKFKRNIQKFKNREDVKVLLLPVSRGANGLNLVEASHVLLVEPIFNPAQELQAIGRVHRIGQTKATVVHRFLVRQTIEERIHQMLLNYHRDHRDLETGGHSTEENLLTIQDLKRLFHDDPDQIEEIPDDADENSGDNSKPEASLTEENPVPVGTGEDPAPGPSSDTLEGPAPGPTSDTEEDPAPGPSGAAADHPENPEELEALEEFTSTNNAS